MVACLAQVLNFTTMLNLFANSPTWYDMTDEERVFEVWIFIEALNIMSTVGCNVLFILYKSIAPTALDIGIAEKDNQVDFLSTEDNQLYIGVLNQCGGPVLVYYMFIHYFRQGGISSKE